MLYTEPVVLFKIGFKKESSNELIIIVVLVIKCPRSQIRIYTKIRFYFQGFT